MTKYSSRTSSTTPNFNIPSAIPNYNLFFTSNNPINVPLNLEKKKD